MSDKVDVTTLLITLREAAKSIPTDALGYSVIQAQIDQWVAQVKDAGFDDFEAGMVMMIFLTHSLQELDTKRLKSLVRLPDFMINAVNDAMKEQLLKAAAIGMRLHA